MNRRKFLSSAVALAVSPALPAVAAPVAPFKSATVELFADPFFKKSIGKIYIDGIFSGEVNDLNFQTFYDVEISRMFAIPPGMICGEIK